MPQEGDVRVMEVSVNARGNPWPPRGWPSSTMAIVNGEAERNRALARIKLLHTAVWVFFVGCIVAIPVAAALGLFVWAAVFSGLVLTECAVLAFNRGRCPLTDMAARHTEDRNANFDIYLPEWLARHNKAVFGTLFTAGELFLAWRWFAG